MTGELVESPFWYLLKSVIICKEGWCVGLEQEVSCVSVEATVWNTLKGGGMEKSGEKTKNLKRRGRLVQEVGALKRWWELKPL